MNFCCYVREMSTIYPLNLCPLQMEVLEFCLSSNTFAKGMLEVPWQHFQPLISQILRPPCHAFVLFLYLFIFSAGCLSGFALQANICGWSHRGPWQKELHLCLHVLLRLPLSCLDLEIKQRV